MKAAMGAVDPTKESTMTTDHDNVLARFDATWTQIATGLPIDQYGGGSFSFRTAEGDPLV